MIAAADFIRANLMARSVDLACAILLESAGKAAPLPPREVRRLRPPRPPAP